MWLATSSDQTRSWHTKRKPVLTLSMVLVVPLSTKSLHRRSASAPLPPASSRPSCPVSRLTGVQAKGRCMHPALVLQWCIEVRPLRALALAVVQAAAGMDPDLSRWHIKAQTWEGCKTDGRGMAGWLRSKQLCFASVQAYFKRMQLPLLYATIRKCIASLQDAKPGRAWTDGAVWGQLPQAAGRFDVRKRQLSTHTSVRGTGECAEGEIPCMPQEGRRAREATEA